MSVFRVCHKDDIMFLVHCVSMDSSGHLKTLHWIVCVKWIKSKQIQHNDKSSCVKGVHPFIFFCCMIIKMLNAKLKGKYKWAVMASKSALMICFFKKNLILMCLWSCTQTYTPVWSVILQQPWSWSEAPSGRTCVALTGCLTVFVRSACYKLEGVSRPPRCGKVVSFFYSPGTLIMLNDRPHQLLQTLSVDERSVC